MRKIQPDNFQALISDQSRKLKIRKTFRFLKEPMIDYLIQQAEIKVSPSELYSAFEASESLEDFLKRAKFTKKHIEKFLDENRDPATRDYQELVLRYFKDTELTTEERNT